MWCRAKPGAYPGSVSSDVSDHQVPDEHTGSAAADDQQVAAPAAGPRYALLLYTLARLGLLIAVGAVLYLLGARTWLLVVLAFAISGLLSFVVLSPLRDAISARMAQRMDANKAKRAEAVRAEEDLY